MPKFVRVIYLPWNSPIFMILVALAFPFASLTSLVLSAMSINGFIKQGGYPPIVMAQEALILTAMVAPMGFSCIFSCCGCSSFVNDEYGEYEASNTLITRYPLPWMILDLIAFFLRVGTTGFYLKGQYAGFYNERMQGVYVLESSAVMILTIIWLLSFSFSFSFYLPLFKRKSDTVENVERSNYSAKQIPIIVFLITIESWTEGTVLDEEAGVTPATATPATATPAATTPAATTPAATTPAATTPAT